LDHSTILLQLKDLEELPIHYLELAIRIIPLKYLQFVSIFELQIILLDLLERLIIHIQVLQITLLIIEPMSIIRIVHPLMQYYLTILQN